MLNQKKLTIALLFSCAAIFGGCATTEGYKKVANSWVGNHVDNLITSWGPPSGIYPLSNGGQVLQYSRQRNVQVGGITYAVPQTTYENGRVNAYSNSGSSAYANYSGRTTTYVNQTTPVENIEMQCVTRFTIDSTGIIRNWAFEGNDCRAKAPK